MVDRLLSSAAAVDPWTPRVVVADDQPAVRTLLAELLVASGFDVVGEAPDGEAAVDLVRRLRPDLLVMDVRMPRLNGAEAAQRVNAELPRTAIVLLTGDADDASIAHLRELAVADILSKGAAARTICDALHRAARRASGNASPIA